jgi:hypothetical protein
MMGGPKGNQHALGNDGGRPRTTSFSEEEMIALGKEMVDWVKANNPIHINLWYSGHKRFTYNEWKSFIQLEEFLPHYQEAMTHIGKNYLDGTINSSIAHRFLRLYFKDLKEIEDNDLVQKHQVEYEFKKNLLELELKLKANGDNLIPDDIKDQYVALIAQMNALQLERKMARNSINAEAKS